MNTINKTEIEKTPLVSVVLSCYNHEKYLVECLESIFNQNYKNFEVIIRDDGSTDNSVKLLNAFLENPNNTNNISYFFEPGQNMGVVKSTNFILSKTKGEIIIFCATDDVFLENRISKAVEIHLLYPRIELITFNAIVIDDDGETIRPSFYPQPLNYSDIELYESLNYKKALSTHFGGFGMTIKKNFLKPINFQLPETLAFEDGYLSFLALMNNGVIKVNTLFMKYRRSKNSLSRGNTSINKSEILLNEKRFLKLFLNLDEHKLQYILNDYSLNTAVTSNKKNSINLLKQRILCLQIKISVLENRKINYLWLQLFWLILSGVKSVHSLKILMISIFKNTLINQIIKDSNNRSKTL